MLHANPPRHEADGTLQCVGLDEVGSGKRFISLVSIYTKITREAGGLRSVRIGAGRQ